MIPCKDFRIWTQDNKCVVRQATTITNTVWGISLIKVDNNERTREQRFSLSSSLLRSQQRLGNVWRHTKFPHEDNHQLNCLILSFKGSEVFITSLENFQSKERFITSATTINMAKQLSFPLRILCNAFFPINIRKTKWLKTYTDEWRNTICLIVMSVFTYLQNMFKVLDNILFHQQLCNIVKPYLWLIEHWQICLTLPLFFFSSREMVFWKCLSANYL